VNLWNKVIHSIFPSFCEVCKRPLNSDEVLVCNNCLKKLPFLTNCCKKCGTPGYSGDYCYYCLEHNFAFDRARVVFRYKEPVNDWIKRLKFSKDFALGFNLGRLLRLILNPAQRDKEEFLCVTIPLSKERQRARGFNQAEIIAKGMGFKTFNEVLKRVKNTPAQARLSAKERWRNVKDAFIASSEVKNRKVLLIDDVMTTGATLNEAAKALKSAGALWIEVLAVARNI